MFAKSVIWLCALRRSRRLDCRSCVLGSKTHIVYVLPFGMIRRADQLIRHLSSSATKTVIDMSKSYEEAVWALNTLQSNAATLDKIKAERDQKRHMSIPDTISQANRAGITLEDIDKLSVIHVSGTKGKGSTCALCESVLRAHGYKTGFFSSPHLVEVRERIRINGRPLSKDAFSTYFWDCYKNLDDTKEAHDGAMPAYFRFLTIMAFRVFLVEKVDVAILEVGIGGTYDCTNIVRNPVVCGVSSLGVDHTTILGDTIDKIAWHKAGIFKPGVPAVTVPQPDNSIAVLEKQAKETGCPLTVSPPLDAYDWSGKKAVLGIPGKMQSLNASLALQLCQIWLQNHNRSIKERQDLYKDYLPGSGDREFMSAAPSFTVTEPMSTGLSACTWPGRNQTIKKKGLTYYIDGAHTPRSMEACADWFIDASRREAGQINGRVVKILLFNTTGDRSPETLLNYLIPCGFNYAVFCPNIHSNLGGKVDQVNLTVSLKSQLVRCTDNCRAWLTLLEGATKHGQQGATDTSNKQTNSQELGDLDSAIDSTRNSPESLPMPTFTFNTIQDSMVWVSQGRDPELPSASELTGTPLLLRNCTHIQVLCAGSLHLVGGILGMIDPSMSD